MHILPGRPTGKPDQMSPIRAAVPYDNALAETVNGLYKTELIYSRPVWETASTVELATMGWVNWWNTQRLHETLDYRPPADVEAAYTHPTTTAPATV